MDSKTVGNSEIAAKIADFINENKSFHRRFLRRINRFNSKVRDVINSVDLRPETKRAVFNMIYKDAIHSANLIEFTLPKVKDGDNTKVSKSYPSYLLITYFKTVWEDIMPYLNMINEQNRLWNDAPIGSALKSNLNEYKEADIYLTINNFIEKKVAELKKI